jgi:YHS domain-containing protein
MSTEHPIAVDPVCAMTVEIEPAIASGLTAEHDGVLYCLCGRGCEPEFGDDPAKYLDPGYTRSM